MGPLVARETYQLSPLPRSPRSWHPLHRPTPHHVRCPPYSHPHRSLPPDTDKPQVGGSERHPGSGPSPAQQAFPPPGGHSFSAHPVGPRCYPRPAGDGSPRAGVGPGQMSPHNDGHAALQLAAESSVAAQGLCSRELPAKAQVTKMRDRNQPSTPPTTRRSPGRLSSPGESTAGTDVPLPTPTPQGRSAGGFPSLSAPVGKRPACSAAGGA